MAVECHLPPLRATLVQVIYFAAWRGNGTPADPVRLANYYFSPDGDLLACHDPINGEPDCFFSPLLKNVTQKTEPPVIPQPAQRKIAERHAAVDPIYYTDDYPREGCKVVISFEKGRYSWIVYPPWIDLTPSGAPLESYFSRGLGSLGIALDAFARGGAQSIETKKEMVRAERTGSNVTE